MMKFATIMKFLKVVVANRQSIARHRHTAEPPVPKLQPIGFDDFLSLDVPPREVLLDPILPERSLAMLYAPRGVGKTLLGDDTEPDPAVHSDVALVAATIEAVSPLDHADTSFAPGAPFLPVAEPALPLLAFAFGALGRAVGNADALDASCFRRRLVLGRVECSIRRHQARRTTQQRLMRLDRGDQQVRIIRPLSIDFDSR